MDTKSIESIGTTVQTPYPHSHRNREVLRTFNAFFHNEATGGVLLLIAAVLSVAFATIPGLQGFDRFWDKQFGLTFGGETVSLSLRLWINDALMAIFFFVVGLEIKREMLVGQLSSIKRSILPIMGALGGMIVPAVLFYLCNMNNPETVGGWGIPMATDIAFAIGVLSILGSKVPTGLKVFLTALAIVDDLGAIIVLAIFYPSHAIDFTYFIHIGLIMALLFTFNRLKVRHAIFYLIPGLFLWYFTYKSGVHATISGVLLAMTIPSKGTINEVRFNSKLQSLVDKFKQTSQSQTNVLASAEQQHIIHSMHKEIQRVDPLMHQLESRLSPIVNYIIMPLFALANAGVALDFSVFQGGIPTISLGIFLGLVLGKPLGIFLFSFLSIKAKIAEKPFGVKWIQFAAITVLGGIGFTMSIFVNGLAFTDPSLVAIGKISILITSTVAAILGILALTATCKNRAERLTPEEILPKETNRIQ